MEILDLLAHLDQEDPLLVSTTCIYDNEVYHKHLCRDLLEPFLVQLDQQVMLEIKVGLGNKDLRGHVE